MLPIKKCIDNDEHDKLFELLTEDNTYRSFEYAIEQNKKELAYRILKDTENEIASYHFELICETFTLEQMSEFYVDEWILNSAKIMRFVEKIDNDMDMVETMKKLVSGKFFKNEFKKLFYHRKLIKFVVKHDMRTVFTKILKKACDDDIKICNVFSFHYDRFRDLFDQTPKQEQLLIYTRKQKYLTKDVDKLYHICENPKLYFDIGDYLVTGNTTKFYRKAAFYNNINILKHFGKRIRQFTKPLKKAASSKYPLSFEVLKFLHKKGADITDKSIIREFIQQDSFNASALYYFINNGVNIDDAFEYAVKYDRIDYIEELLEYKPSNINKVKTKNKDILMILHREGLTKLDIIPNDLKKEFSSQCVTCLSTELCITKPKNLCLPCYQDEYKKTITRREKEWSKYLNSKFGTKYLLSTDRAMKYLGGCSNKRPDKVYNFDNCVLMIEFDEHCHSNYTCEDARISEIYDDIKEKPMIFIRYNPDKYVPPKGITKKLKAEKLEILIKLIKTIQDKKWETPIYIYYLFYKPVKTKYPHEMIY